MTKEKKVDYLPKNKMPSTQANPVTLSTKISVTNAKFKILS